MITLTIIRLGTDPYKLGDIPLHCYLFDVEGFIILIAIGMFFYNNNFCF